MWQCCKVIIRTHSVFLSLRLLSLYAYLLCITFSFENAIASWNWMSICGQNSRLLKLHLMTLGRLLEDWAQITFCRQSCGSVGVFCHIIIEVDIIIKIYCNAWLPQLGLKTCFYSKASFCCSRIVFYAKSWYRNHSTINR